MKKTQFIMAAAAAALYMAGIHTVYAAEPQVLEFQPVGGGTFIYCNNPEAVDSNTLVNSDKPRYIMNNDNLGPGKYYLYISQYNYIGMDSTGDKVSKDMELDVEFTPASDSCTYTISNIGFEAITTYAWEDNGMKRVGVDDWGMFNCCAEAMQMDLINENGTVYKYKALSEAHTITADGTRWLSEFTPNYCVVHYKQPVHYQAVLEIKSGTMNVNVCAFEAGDKLGDRSGFRKDSENGIVRYDRTIKGLVDTMPQVEADLDYTIDDTTADGDYLPVISYNQYAPDGIILNEWYTNLDPLDDPWAKQNADESGMLAFTYKDPHKLTYYGKNVPESKRTDIWYFDTKHSDTHAYENQPGTKGADNYSPNYELTAEDDTNGWAVNLGNYGVTYTYNLSITNNGGKTRYFTYAPTVASRIIVFTNENGKKADYGIIKNDADTISQSVMSVVELPAGETTEFSVNMTLPVNYNGGVRNAFIIRDYAKLPDYRSRIDAAQDKQYVKPITGEYLSFYKDKLPAGTLAAFEGMLDCYEVIGFGKGYALRWCEWDGSPYSYYSSWWLCEHIYILDENFNIAGHYTFSSLPIGMSYNNGLLYVQTAANGIFSSEDGLEWKQEFLTVLPENEEPERTYRFDEVNSTASDWAYDNLRTAYNYGLIPGDVSEKLQDGTKRFTDGITRKEFCGIAARVIKRIGTVELPSAVEISFSDCSDSDVCSLAALGVVDGYDDNTFRPDYTITREEAAAVLARLLMLYSFNETTDIAYADRAQIQDWAKIPVAVMLRYDIMNGVDDSHFSPKGSYTVEQAVVTLLRALNVVTDIS